MRILTVLYFLAMFALVMFVYAPGIVLGQAPSALDRAKEEGEINKVLDEFMTSFNRTDATAHQRTYHFPHYRLASGRMTVLEKPGAESEAKLTELFKGLQAAGWDHSEWKRRRIVHLSESKAHIDTEFARYRKDGSLIGKYESLYVLTKENGHWGVKMRSSFAE
jgi:hypothetical protein